MTTPDPLVATLATVGADYSLATASRVASAYARHERGEISEPCAQRLIDDAFKNTDPANADPYHEKLPPEDTRRSAPRLASKAADLDEVIS